MTDIEFAEDFLKAVKNGEVEIHPQDARFVKANKAQLVLYLECDLDSDFAITITCIEEEMQEYVYQERVNALLANKLNILSGNQKESNQSRVERFAYLMIDERNGLYKIGRSKNPEYREKTLQSEVPQIKMICFCSESKVSEKDLHKAFAHRRVRGEWFDLTKNDLSTIKNLMQA